MGNVFAHSGNVRRHFGEEREFSKEEKLTPNALPTYHAPAYELAKLPRTREERRERERERDAISYSDDDGERILRTTPAGNSKRKTRRATKLPMENTGTLIRTPNSFLRVSYASAAVAASAAAVGDRKITEREARERERGGGNART